MSLGIKILSTTYFSITILSISTFSLTTLSIKIKNVTLSILTFSKAAVVTVMQ